MDGGHLTDEEDIEGEDVYMEDIQPIVLPTQPLRELTIKTATNLLAEPLSTESVTPVIPKTKQITLDQVFLNFQMRGVPARREASAAKAVSDPVGESSRRLPVFQGTDRSSYAFREVRP